MSTRQQLGDAVAVFVELGWDQADPTQVGDLPLGTPEQRRRAREGLRSGAWGAFGEIGRNTYGWVSHVDVDETMLAAFAVRVGVDARRAAQVMQAGSDDLFVPLVVARGREFAQRVVVATRGGGRSWEHAASWGGALALRLVDAFDLPIPDDVDYLKDWAAYAVEVVGVHAPSIRDGSGPEAGRWQHPVVMRRFVEHVHAAAAAGVPATGPFAQVFREGVRTGLLSRDEAVDLAFGALDAARRPGDRKVWASILATDLALTPAEMLQRADALVAVLATGDAALIETFAPALLEGVADDDLHDVLATALTVRTAKALRVVVAATSRRPPPPTGLVHDLAPLLAPLTEHKDRALARAAQQLLDHWDATILEPLIVSGEDPVRGLWQATPEVWQVPRFDAGEVTQEALTDAAAVLLRRPEGVTDVETERFLALANALARDDATAARTALRGVGQTWNDGLRPVRAWVRGTLGTDDDDDEGAWPSDPLEARTRAVFARLGDLPCLLSEPTWVDLRIDPADLIQRLNQYAATGTAVEEADLQLALLRCDTTLWDPTDPSATDPLAAAPSSTGFGDVPVRLHTGAVFERTAGRIVRDYLTDPVVEPAIEMKVGQEYWGDLRVKAPQSLSGLPGRVWAAKHMGPNLQAVFPTWQVSALQVTHRADSALGHHLRQMARRAGPLGPALAVNMLGAQRPLHPAAAADGTAAVTEAWQRGLLRPGSADVGYLDGRTTPTAVAALAEALHSLAEDGMLSVVWPVLDDLLVASTTGPRLLPGTAEVAEAMGRLAPEVVAAVEDGLATDKSLAVPGLRTLASRAGSSRAVTLARAAVATLPDVSSTSPPADPAPPVAPPRLDPPFEVLWPPGAGTAVATVDDCQVTVGSCDPTAPTKHMFVDLVLREEQPTAVRAHLGWTHPIRAEGQCVGVVVEDGRVPTPAADVWMRWDGETSRMVVSQFRDWENHTNDPPSRRAQRPPVTTSMIAMLLVGACQDRDHALEPLQTFAALYRHGEIGSDAVKHALRVLGSQELVGPARLARIIEQHPQTLPATWPILQHSIQAAAVAVRPPVWLNRVLDVTLGVARYLRLAAESGYLPADAAAWPGLSDLAVRPGKAAGVRKSREIVAALSPPQPEPAGDN